MSTSYTFLFQPPRAIMESDLRLFRANCALTLVRISRHLLEVEGPEEDLKALASALGPDWVSHPTSTTPFPGPEVGHPIPFPASLVAVTHPAYAQAGLLPPTPELMMTILAEAEAFEQVHDALLASAQIQEASAAAREKAAKEPPDLRRKLGEAIDRVSQVVTASMRAQEALDAYDKAAAATDKLFPGLPTGHANMAERVEQIRAYADRVTKIRDAIQSSGGGGYLH
jgi:hypothetical protein